MTKILPSFVKLAEPVLGKPVRIFVWKNGDFDGAGEEIIISPKALRSWNSILVYLTKLLKPTGAIRKLYHLSSKKAVWCFDELVRGDSYVAAGFEKLKYEDNAYHMVSERRYSILQTTKFTTKSESIKAMLDTITYTQRRKRTIIYIMVNGKSCEPPCKIVFIEDDLHDWESVLQYIGHRLNVPEGIQYICTVNGEIVFEAHQLHHGDLYIGVPFGERFKKVDYVKMFYDLVKQQKEKSGYVTRKSNRKNKMNLSTFYAPWSIEHKKSRRFSATISTPSPLNKISPKKMTFPGRHSPRPSLQNEAPEKPGSSGQNQDQEKSQTGRTQHIKHRLGSVINACLNAVENSGFIEPQKANQFHQAKKIIQKEIQKISARNVDNEMGTEEEISKEGTNLTTFAQLAKKTSCFKSCKPFSKKSEDSVFKPVSNLENQNLCNSIRFCPTPLKKQHYEHRNVSKDHDEDKKSETFIKSVSFENKDLVRAKPSTSTSSEMTAVRTFSKKSLTGREISQLRKLQEKRGSIPCRDSIDLYKRKISRDTSDHKKIETVQPVTSDLNFVRNSANGIGTSPCHIVPKSISDYGKINNCKGFKIKESEQLSCRNSSSDCYEIILDTRDAEVNELWKKRSAPSTDKSIEERPSDIITSKNTDTNQDAEITQTTGNSLQIGVGSELAINCCTLSKIEAVVKRIKQKENVGYISSDEDPFIASERHAKTNNVFSNKASPIFGQLGSMVNGSGEHIEKKPPADGIHSKLFIKKDKSSEEDLNQLVKIKSISEKTTIINLATNPSDSSNKISVPLISNSNVLDSKTNSNIFKKSSSRVRMLSPSKEKIQILDPIASCSEQSSGSRNTKPEEKTKSSGDSLQNKIEEKKDCFRETCSIFGCSKICLNKF